MSINSGGAEIKNANKYKKKKSRPTSLQFQTGGKRSNRKPIDQARENKRKQVILEFYATEQAYVDGLELIYSVSTQRTSTLGPRMLTTT